MNINLVFVYPFLFFTIMKTMFKKFPQIKAFVIQFYKDQETIQYHLKKDFGRINFALTVILYLFPVLIACCFIYLSQQPPTIIGLESSQCKMTFYFAVFLAGLWLASIIIKGAIIHYIIWFK